MHANLSLLSGRITLIAIVAAQFGCIAPVFGQDAAITETVVAAKDATDDGGLDEERRLKFSFSSTPWKEVLEWIAEECDLSFTLDYSPPGSLNFIDPDRLYTPSEALDEINGQLAARGFTLIRRYKTLYIVDLQSDVDRKFISDMLNDTAIENIDKLGRFELGKVVFQLKAISTEDAEKQIENMIGPQGLAITIPLARQMIISETGENLRRIKKVLENVESRVGSEGLRSFRMKHATGDDVLAVAKPLLGIELDKSSAEDGTIRISTDTKGKVVYATGAPEKIALVEQIVKQVDADAAENGEAAQQSFISHKVRREDPKVVMRILETVFSGDSRLRLQTQADSILAYATLDQHRTIESVISEAEQDPASIDVIPLRRVDPLLAVALIERMFGADGDDPDENAPVVDARFDPNQLIINGNAAQLEKIRGLLGKLGERVVESGEVAGPTMRMLPISEDAMPDAIRQLERMWPAMGKKNPIRIVPSQSAPPLFRVVPREEEEMYNKQPKAEPDAADKEEPKKSSDRDNITASPAAFRTVFVSKPVAQAESESEPVAPTPTPAPSDAAPEIIISQTPDGLAIITQDGAAADELEDLLMQVVGSQGGTKFHIFHLKHVKCEEAQTLVESLLTGAVSEESSSSDRTGALALFGGGSSSTLGAPKIIADKRLNRLFVEGTRSQIRNIEQALKFIDVEDGPVDVETNPKPTYIPVINTSAEAIVEVLKEVYADRLYNANSRQQQQGGRGGFGGFGGFGGRGGGDTTQPTASTGEIAKMTLAAEPASNLVIVSAPGPLVKEVEEVVRRLDEWAEMSPSEEYTIGTLSSSVTPDGLKAMLKGAYPEMILTEGEGLASGTRTSSNNQAGGGNTQAGQADQRRAAFLQMIQGGGATGRGGGGRGGAAGGGGRGGGATGGRGGGGGGRGGRGG